MNWLYIFLGFSLLIILHEAGHFVAAKATGMRVERFFLFFGPTIWSFKRGETEYGIKSIPLGGYVKITGMNPEEEVPPEDEHRAYYRQPVWKRIVVVAAGPAVNIVLAFAILFVVFLVSAQQVDQTVGEIRAGTPGGEGPAAGRPDRRRRRQALPGLDREARLEQLRQAGRLATNAPASRSTAALAATPVALTVSRDGEPRTISVRPEYDKANEAGPGRRSPTAPKPVDVSAGTAASRAVRLDLAGHPGTASIFSRIFEEEQRKQISGIVGVSDVANQTIDVGVDAVAAAARPGQPLARPDQPAADPAARRRPHLLGAGRETARRRRSRCG